MHNNYKMGLKVTITPEEPPPLLTNPSITILYINKDFLFHKTITVNFTPENITFPIPQKFYLDGVEVDSGDSEMTTFYDNVFKLIAQCEESDTALDISFEEWVEDDEFNTIGIMYNNILAFPDILDNLTSVATHPKEIQNILQAIYNNTKAYFQQDIICPELKRGWYEKRLVKHLNCELAEQRFLQKMHRHRDDVYAEQI